MLLHFEPSSHGVTTDLPFSPRAGKYLGPPLVTTMTKCTDNYLKNSIEYSIGSQAS